MKKRPQKEIEERIEHFNELCRQHDLKITHQRLEIFRALLETIDHPTAEEVFQRIRHKLPTVSIDTVYRTLTLFESYNLISRVQCLSDKGRFDSNVEPHHHFICTQCKKIQDFYWPEFEQLELPENALSLGEMKVKRVELRGICEECKKDEIEQ